MNDDELDPEEEPVDPLKEDDEDEDADELGLETDDEESAAFGVADEDELNPSNLSRHGFGIQEEPETY